MLPARQTHFGSSFERPFGENTFSENAPPKRLFCFTVFDSLDDYLNRYGSSWTKFQLKPSILNPNRDI